MVERLYSILGKASSDCLFGRGDMCFNRIRLWNVYHCTKVDNARDCDWMEFDDGIIMIMLGMIGEYVGRIYICENNLPQFVVREIVRGHRRD